MKVEEKAEWKGRRRVRGSQKRELRGGNQQGERGGGGSGDGVGWEGDDRQFEKIKNNLDSITSN